MNREQRERRSLLTLEQVKEYMQNEDFSQVLAKLRREFIPELDKLYQKINELEKIEQKLSSRGRSKEKIEEELMPVRMKLYEEARAAEDAARELGRIKAIAWHFKIPEEEAKKFLDKMGEKAEEEGEGNEKKPLVLRRALEDGFAEEKIRDFIFSLKSKIKKSEIKKGEIILEAEESRIAYVMNGEEDRGILFLFLPSEDLGPGKNRVKINGKIGMAVLEELIDYFSRV